jgi:hypothetical protein
MAMPSIFEVSAVIQYLADESSGRARKTQQIYEEKAMRIVRNVLVCIQLVSAVVVLVVAIADLIHRIQ